MAQPESPEARFQRVMAQTEKLNAKMRPVGEALVSKEDQDVIEAMRFDALMQMANKDASRMRQPSEGQKKLWQVGKALTGYSDPTGFPINPRRTAGISKHGGAQTERTMTIEVDGTYYNVPTVHEGKEQTREKAMERAMNSIRKSKAPPYPSYDSLQEAITAAEQRSHEIGYVRQESAAKGPQGKRR